MERWQQPLLLLCLTAMITMNIVAKTAKAMEGFTLTEKNLTSRNLQAIPHCGNSCSLTKLVIDGNLITLNEEDQKALASYPALVELHLVGNRVNHVPAKYFSVVPHLRVLSLSRNNITGLDPEAFFGLDVLTELDLSHNQLTSLPTQLFKGLNNLQVLNLRENPLNCSCPLLTSIREAIAANISIGGAEDSCASPEKPLDAIAECYLSQTTTFTTDPRTPPTMIPSQESWSPSTMLKTTLSLTQNQTINEGEAKIDQRPFLGNTWKFTACVAALALTTSTLIVCGIKGPSWYKLFHNYQHRRLDQEEDNEEDIVSTAFSGTERFVNHQVFTFEQESGKVEMAEEEEDDEYFEDPYIKRED
ncbi:leucine-rich repeat-containing protein 19-like [Echeneis naucrates]|uniref:leucine-rich repeat-containing protein 19-like n=1 Tax=Echeneis naucrates TaxID=173247 RepID=UPI001113B043|nr:leucine-rich repeat-containing protein 19 [Echeneis naucrates]